MPVLPFWYDQPDAWDQVQLGPMLLPGLCKISIQKAIKVDVKMSPGVHGATLTTQGYKPAKVTITLRMFTPDQWATIQRFLPSLEPSPSKADPTPFDILNAKANVRGIKAILIEDITGPDEGSVRGSMELKFNCIEFLPPPPKPATATPKNSLLSGSNVLFPALANAPSKVGAVFNAAAAKVKGVFSWGNPNQ